MTDVRITQGAIEVLETPERPSIKITQVAIEVLHNDVTPAPEPPDPEVAGSVRDTQIVTLALGAVGVDARLTQSVLLAMGTPSPDVRFTQMSPLVLAEVDVDVRLTQGAHLVLADSVCCKTQWTQVWKITRQDGQIFAYTALDRDITYHGTVYQSCCSMRATATQSSISSGSFGSMELSGLLSDSGIMEQDVYYGLFEGASVESWLVPWNLDSNETPTRLFSGEVGNTNQDITGFTFEIVTPGAKLNQRSLLDFYTPGCRYKLGDSRCGVELEGVSPTFDYSGVVESVTDLILPNAGPRRIFTDTGSGLASGYFDNGQLLWSSGANNGISSDIKSFNGSQFELRLALPYPISPGDTFHALPGCDKSPETCANKFDNFINFGGFPHVPGEDQYFKTPNAK